MMGIVHVGISRCRSGHFAKVILWLSVGLLDETVEAYGNSELNGERVGLVRAKNDGGEGETDEPSDPVSSNSSSPGPHLGGNHYVR
jgi:hypothetical protein